MNVEEKITQYKYLIPITIGKMFSNAEGIAQLRGLEKSDLEQYGLIGLWEACKNWDSEKGKFTSFAISNIRWYIGKSLVREGKHDSIFKASNTKRKKDNVKVNIISMSYQPYDDSEMNFYDTVAVDNIVNFETEVIESKLIGKESYESICNLLTDREKEMVNMKANGMNYTQIGEVYGVKKQAIGHRFTRLQDKIRRHMGVVQ